MNRTMVLLQNVAFFQEGPGVRNWQFRDKGVKLINVKNIVDGELITENSSKYLDPEEVEKNYSHFLADNGDLVMASSGATWGKTAWVEEKHLPLCMNTSMIRFKPLDPKVLDIRFLRRFLNSSLFKRQMGQLITGSAQPNFGSSHLKQIEIPLPPLPEQKRIAAILDKTDEIRRKREAAIAKLDQLAQSIFVEMFGDPLTNEKGWKVGSSIQHCKCIVPGRDKPKKFSGDIPWVTTNDLNRLTYTDKSKNNIGLTVEEIAEVRAKIIPENSVILTCVGDLGVVSINSSPVVINQQLHSFQCDNLNILPIFMMYVLSHQTPYMYKMASSTTVPYMNKTVCNNIPMIYPPITLQKEFANKINKLEHLKANNIAALTKQNHLFNTLQHQAFTGAL